MGRSSELALEPIRRCKKCKRKKLLGAFPVTNYETLGRRHECRDCHNWRMRTHYIKTREHRLKRAQERYRSRPFLGHTPEQRAQLSENSKERYQRDKALVLAHYGRRCLCCGETE